MRKLDIEFIKQCVSDGLTDREIAEKLNCNRVSVTRVRNKNNIKKRSVDDIRDKYYVCVNCKKKVFIKRKDTPKLMCDDCLISTNNI